MTLHLLTVGIEWLQPSERHSDFYGRRCSTELMLMVGCADVAVAVVDHIGTSFSVAPKLQQSHTKMLKTYRHSCVIHEGTPAGTTAITV